MTTDQTALWESAASAFDERHRLVRPEHHSLPTPCSEFDVAAGSLLLPNGEQTVDQDSFPDEVRPEALAQGELLDLFCEEADDLEWSYLSPAGQIEPGERTGEFTLGKDELVADEEGNSVISAEDYAVALIDELEKNDHARTRFTAAYT